MDWQILKNTEEIDGYYRNVLGAPVQSASHDSGLSVPFADVYTFTFASVTTVSVAGSSHNPMVFAGSRTVVCDGATGNTNLLSGWSFVFRSDVQVGDKFEVGAGCFEGLRILNRGSRVPNFPTSATELTAKNISGGTLAGCRVVATNKAWILNTSGVPFLSQFQRGFANPISDDDLSGSAITFTANGAAFDLLIGGETVDIYDVDNATFIPGGVALTDGVLYQFPEGSKYQGLAFELDSSICASDTATIYVSDGGRGCELAQATGDYSAGPDGVEITEAGQVDGTVTNNGEVVFRLRFNPPSMDSDLNMRGFSLRIGSVTDEAEVDGFCDYSGSYDVLDFYSLPLVWRLSLFAALYDMPQYSETTASAEAQHYSYDEEEAEYVEDAAGEYIEDPNHAGQYIYAQYELDSSGTYVPDPMTKNRFIISTSHARAGKYTSLTDIFSASGITVISG